MQDRYPSDPAAIDRALGVRKRSRILHAAAGACGGLIAVAGLTAVVGWHWEQTRLVQFSDLFPPMHYLTAWGFLALGAALLLTHHRKPALAAAAAAPALCIGSLTLLDNFLPTGIQLNQRFTERILGDSAPGVESVAPNTAVCFIVAAAAILCSTLTRNQRMGVSTAGVLGSFIVGVGFVALTGDILGIDGVFGWGRHPPMAVHTSLGLLLAGAATVLLAASRTVSFTTARWLSLAAGIGLLAAGAGLWQALADEQRKRVAAQLNSRANELMALVELGMKNRISLLERMADRWEGDTKTKEARWRRDAAAAVRTVPGFLAIEWVDADYTVRWIEPLAGNEETLGLQMHRDPVRRAAMIRAQTTGVSTATDAVHLAEGDRGFLIFAPVGEGEHIAGFVLGVFRIKALFDELTKSVHNDFHVSVYEGQTRLYGERPKQSSEIFPFTILGNRWEIQVEPAEDYVRLLQSTLPHQVMAGSTVVAVLVTIAIFLAQSTQRNVHDLRAAKKELAALNAGLETRVRERTAELESANKELNEFTYVASHDLQEPLRKQQMFTAILDEEVGDDLSDDAHRAMRAINNASSRMQELIRSLLELSRARNRDLNVRSVELNTIVNDVLTTLSLRLDESGARVKVAALPRVMCDPVLVTQVFQNLVLNAIRYAQSETNPEIVISAVNNGDFVEVAVQDAGIGIPEVDLEHIFLPFKRLHPRHVYPGTGIGLSICKNVVERHGGRIWAQSNGSGGAAFRFTLPKSGKHKQHAGPH